MKVLHVNAVIGYSSTGRIVLDLSNEISDSEHQSYIAYSEGIEKYDYTYQIGSKLGKKIHGLLSRVFGKQAYYSRYSTRKLLKYIDILKPDIVHIHNLHSNYINLGVFLKYLSKNNIPTALTMHDCWFYTGKCTHYTVKKCFRWKKQCGNCVSLGDDNPSWFFDRTQKMLSDKKKWFSDIKKLAVIGVSDWITSEVKKSILSDAKILKRIYNWVDLDFFKPTSSDFKKQLKIENKFVILGMVNKWLDPKNISTIKNILENISEDTVVVLLGQKMDCTKKISSKINFVGHVDNMEDLVKYYSMADCFVNLSFEDSFGLVTAESLACGTPVILYNSTGAPELIGENCGYVVKIKDSDEIINAINTIKVKTKSYYSQSCFDFVKSNFEKKEKINEYLDVYKELLR